MHVLIDHSAHNSDIGFAFICFVNLFCSRDCIMNTTVINAEKIRWITKPVQGASISLCLCGLVIRSRLILDRAELLLIECLYPLYILRLYILLSFIHFC